MILRINILGVLCALALINPLSMMGQDKQFTLHDLIPGGKTQSRFVPRNLKQLQWCGDTYLYVKGDSMMSGESTKGGESRLYPPAVERSACGGRCAVGWRYALLLGSLQRSAGACF